MSRSRRNFSAEFKTNLVLQLLKGEKELNVLAVENDIQPNLLRNWKKEFLANASLAFDNKREDNLREKLAEERKEKAEYAKKVGQLTMQVDWLKKNLKKLSDLTTRVNLVRNLLTTKERNMKRNKKRHQETLSQCQFVTLFNPKCCQKVSYHLTYFGNLFPILLGLQ